MIPPDSNDGDLDDQPSDSIDESGEREDASGDDEKTNPGPGGHAAAASDAASPRDPAARAPVDFAAQLPVEEAPFASSAVAGSDDAERGLDFDESEVTNSGPSPFTLTAETAAPPDDDEPGTGLFHVVDDPGLGAGGAALPFVDEEPGPSPPIEADAPSRLPSILESLLLVADRPLSSVDLAALVGEPDPGKVTATLGTIATDLLPRGIHLHNVAGGWQLRTNPINAAWVQKLLAAKPVRLTRAQLETLAIVGYRQPITRPEIDEIRGVDSGGTLKTLLDRSLVRILGKKEEPGRPLLYGTTKEFLEFFNLRDLRDLPTLREFHELSEEHQAQVAALEGAAPPGAVEPPDPGSPAKLERVDLPEVTEEDMSKIDSMIDAAGAKAQAAADAIGAESAQHATDAGEPSGEGA